MSQKSKQRQLARAEETENWEGIYNYRKGNRKKLPVKGFRDGRLGTLNLGNNKKKKEKRALKGVRK